MSKSISVASLSLLAAGSLSADGSSLQIPEGKITDYHCIHPDITPSAGPGVVGGIDMFVAGDYLYWTAREDNLQYASTGFSESGVGSVPRGTTQSPHFRYNDGFKATLGFNFGHDHWNTNFTYTWFQSNRNRSSVSGDYSSGLVASVFPSIPMTSTDYFTSASTLWGIHFNAVDWELGRNCYISKYLSLRPFLGLKGSWQRQIFNNTYGGFVSNLPVNYLSNNRMFFWGVGLHLGMETSWHLSESWSFYGNFALSALWSNTKTRRKDSYTASSTTVNPINLLARVNTLSPVLELSMGLRKDLWIYRDRVHIGIQFGWEEQVWWDQNQFSLEKGVSRGGNLFLQGLTARFRLDF